MRAGTLRHVCTLERGVTSGLDEHGQPVVVWQPLLEINCSIEPLTGRAVEFGRQLFHKATHQVTMQWHPDVSINDRIKFKGRDLYIGHIVNSQERDRELQLLCSEDG